MLGRDEQIYSGFVDSHDFPHCFGFASREAIFETREFSKTHQVGFHQACDRGVATIKVKGSTLSCKLRKATISFWQQLLDKDGCHGDKVIYLTLLLDAIHNRYPIMKQMLQRNFCKVSLLSRQQVAYLQHRHLNGADISVSYMDTSSNTLHNNLFLCKSGYQGN